MEHRQLKIAQLIALMESPIKEKCFRIYESYKDRFEKAPGSKTKHQAWYGGYLDHVEEVMNIAIRQYQWMNAQRPLPFTLSDALFVLFLLSSPSFQFPFPSACHNQCREAFGIFQNYRAAEPGVVRTIIGSIMLVDSAFQIVGAANVVRAVSAEEDVDVVHRERIAEGVSRKI